MKDAYYEGEEKTRELANLSIADHLCTLCQKYRKLRGEPPAAFMVNVGVFPRLTPEDHKKLCAPAIPMLPTSTQFYSTDPGGCVVQLVDDRFQAHVKL